MKPNTKKKLKAWLCLLGTMLLTLVMAEITFLLLIWYPFLKYGGGLKGIGAVLLIAWLYGSMYLWNKAVRRRTRWLDIIDGKQPAQQKINSKQPIEQKINGKQPIEQETDSKQPIEQKIDSKQPIEQKGEKE